VQIGSAAAISSGRRLSTKVDLDTVAAFVKVGSFDSFTELLTVDVAALVFSGGTDHLPITKTPCELDRSIASDYYSFSASDCDWGTRPHLSFYWERPPPGACELPANATANEYCEFSYPWKLHTVKAMVLVPASLPLLLAVGFVVLVCHLTARFATDVLRKNYGADAEYSRSVPLDLKHQLPRFLTYGLVWLGAAAHAVATPIAFSDQPSGHVSDEACVVRTAVVVIAPALVVLGVTARVGLLLSARPETQQQAEPDTEFRRRITEFRRRILINSGLLFLLLLTVVVGLAWVLNSDRRRSGGPAAQAFNHTNVVDLGSAVPTTFVLEYSRCRGLLEFDGSIVMALVVPPYGMCL
jgi:hypothetical protein